MTHPYEGRGIERGESSVNVKSVKWIHGATLGLCESATSPIVSQNHATCIEGCVLLNLGRSSPAGRTISDTAMQNI